ncbi:MAG: hypothetical protein WAW81_02495, partial [Minisyncoccia bacterium]
MMNKSVLIIFKNQLPFNDENWEQKFETVIAPLELKEAIDGLGINFVDINSLLRPGSVEEASEWTRKLSLVTNRDGERLSKVVKYQGFELWWMHYDDLMYRFCLPYTQYASLLKYLAGFRSVTLYGAPFTNLFQFYLKAHDSKVIILDKSLDKSISLGVVLQLLISIFCILWIKIKSPKVMVWTGDKLHLPLTYDYRMKFIYDELNHKGIKFIEFIRSMESTKIVLEHAIKRKRAVVYSFAIGSLARSLYSLIGRKSKALSSRFESSTELGAEQKFWYLVASHYLHNVEGDILSIRVMKLVLKFIGIKVAVVDTALSRNFTEVLACKLSDIPVIGIQHAATPRSYFVSDFMNGFDGEKTLSVDVYGLWSKWWKEYYIKNSKAYRPTQFQVSGPMYTLKNRSLDIKAASSHSGKIKVLFVSEQLAAPSEILPYLEELIKAPNISLYLKFRAYRDGFEDWLRANYPQMLTNLGEGHLLKGSMDEAIIQSDVIVGSHSTGVLEALLRFKPLIFFYTNKWGDYYSLRGDNKRAAFFAENPKELIEKIENAKSISMADIK